MKKILLFFVAIAIAVVTFGQIKSNSWTMPTLATDFAIAIPAYSTISVQSNDNVYLVTSYYTTAHDMSDVITDGNYVDLTAGGGAGFWESNAPGFISAIAGVTTVQIGSDGDNWNGVLQFVSDDGDLINVAIDNSDRLAFTGGNVGFGTATPAYPVDVSGSINLTSEYRINTNIAIDDGGGILIFGNTGNYDEGQYGVDGVMMLTNSSGADYLAFYVTGAGEERMRIIANGNVGIGLIAPTEELEVVGTVKADTLIADVILTDKLGAGSYGGNFATLYSDTLYAGRDTAATMPNGVMVADSATGQMYWIDKDSVGFIDPMTTRGDILGRNASNLTTRLGIGANTHVLTSDGTDYTWAAASGGGDTSYFTLANQRITAKTGVTSMDIDTVMYASDAYIHSSGTNELYAKAGNKLDLDVGTSNIIVQTTRVQIALGLTADVIVTDVGVSIKTAANPTEALEVQGNIATVGGNDTIKNYGSGDYAHFEDVLVDDDLTVTGNITSDPMLSCYAFADSSVLIALTQNTWTRITNTANTLFTSKVAEDFTNIADTIKATDSCAYASIYFSISAEFSASDAYKMRVLKNGTTQLGCAAFTGKVDVTSFSSKCITPVAVNDYFELQIVNTTDNDDATVVCGRMVIIKEF